MEEQLVSFLTVAAVRRLSPHMVRITFTGKALGDLARWPDQQLKLIFPRPGQSVPRLPVPGKGSDAMRWYQAYLAIPENERPWLRSYTVRAHHPDRSAIDIDFVLHGDPHLESYEQPGRAPDGRGDGLGPATRWALAAQPGDVIGRYGPSADYARPLGAADWYLLVGDQTALPAIATLLESLPEGARALAWIEVGEAADEQRIDSRAEVSLHWLHRDGTLPGRGGALLEAVRGAEFPAGSAFAWLAGESSEVRALRRHLVHDRGLGKQSIEFTGYWRLKLSQDDAPTPEDLAEARERLAQARAGGAGEG
ncbi:siderophore-interacting protein [Kitasatospora cystarginea]|uniref:Siderophore-interacting protein n=1 Tax=Kitasatospora cystarginea TaxID=58350 RepID=A0ABN3EPJ7_9ACTN